MRLVRPLLLPAAALSLGLAASLFAQPALAWKAAEQVATYPVYGTSGPVL